MTPPPARREGVRLEDGHQRRRDGPGGWTGGRLRRFRPQPPLLRASFSSLAPRYTFPAMHSVEGAKGATAWLCRPCPKWPLTAMQWGGGPETASPQPWRLAPAEPAIRARLAWGGGGAVGIEGRRANCLGLSVPRRPPALPPPLADVALSVAARGAGRTAARAAAHGGRGPHFAGPAAVRRPQSRGSTRATKLFSVFPVAPPPPPSPRRVGGVEGQGGGVAGDADRRARAFRAGAAAAAAPRGGGGGGAPRRGGQRHPCAPGVALFPSRTGRMV